MAEITTRITPMQALDSNGDPVAGAKAYFYITGTTTVEPVYSDIGLTTAHASPLVADSEGVFAEVYHARDHEIKVKVTDANDADLFTIDPVPMTGQIGFSSTGITDNADQTVLTIDANENFMINTTNTAPAPNDVAGVVANVLGYLDVSRPAGGAPLRVNTDGASIHVQFYTNGSAVGYIRDDGALKLNSSAGAVTLLSGGTTLVTALASGVFRSGGDGTADLGTASFRWDDVYAVNATIQTSDQNDKQDIAALSAAEKRVALAIKAQAKTYRWKGAVADKGAAARTHTGFIAQEVQAAFEAEGLDPWAYGILTRTPVTKTVTRSRNVEKQRYVTVRQRERDVEIVNGEPVMRVVSKNVSKPVTTPKPVFDEAGEPVMRRGKQVLHRVPVMETVSEDYEVEIPAGEKLGLRYSELLAFIVGAL